MELNLKVIDTPEKAFLIGYSNCQPLHYWKDTREALSKNILVIEYALHGYKENERQIIYDWFVKTFGDYIVDISLNENRYNHKKTWLKISIQITPESKDNLQCKYIPIKKTLYDYYIRGMFYGLSFRKNSPAYQMGYKGRLPFTIVGCDSLIYTLCDKLYDYYGLYDYEIRDEHVPNHICCLNYTNDLSNIKYFDKVWENSNDLFDFSIKCNV